MPIHLPIWILLVTVSCIIALPAVIRVSRGKNSKEDE